MIPIKFCVGFTGNLLGLVSGEIPKAISGKTLKELQEKSQEKFLEEFFKELLGKSLGRNP